MKRFTEKTKAEVSGFKSCLCACVFVCFLDSGLQHVYPVCLAHLHPCVELAYRCILMWVCLNALLYFFHAHTCDCVYTPHMAVQILGYVLSRF